MVVVADHRLVLPRIDAAGAAVNRADVDGERRRHGAGNGAAPAGAAAAVCCLAESSQPIVPRNTKMFKFFFVRESSFR